MKRLTIIYGDFTVFDADVSECDIKDAAAGITVVGKTGTAPRRPAAGGGMAGILNGLAAAAKKQQELAEAPGTDLADVLESEDAAC